jgi:hypothetical protein
MIDDHLTVGFPVHLWGTVNRALTSRALGLLSRGSAEIPVTLSFEG